MTSEIARLSVEIDDVTPRVLRIVEVPADIRLDDLHFVLQIAIGWQNGHPFEFRIGDKLWGQPDRDAGIDRTPAEQSTLRDILAALHAAPTVAHMDLPAFRLHRLKGQMKGFWAVTVRANWRVIFRFDGDAEDVDYVDYH